MLSRDTVSLKTELEGKLFLQTICDSGEVTGIYNLNARKQSVPWWLSPVVEEMFLISLPFWVESHKNFICLNSSAILINKNNWQLVRDGTLRFRKLKVCRTPRFRKFKIDSVGSSMQYLIQKYFLFIKITGAIYIEWDIYTCNPPPTRILGQNTLNSVSCINYATMYFHCDWHPILWLQEILLTRSVLEISPGFVLSKL